MWRVILAAAVVCAAALGCQSDGSEAWSHNGAGGLQTTRPPSTVLTPLAPRDGR
ncbi:MAG TPA: hypothetical protein VFA26_03315 [Gemmataceae bacterium]|nr:hypothetical protein [Gemmataceae bacterium]